VQYISFNIIVLIFPEIFFPAPPGMRQVFPQENHIPVRKIVYTIPNVLNPFSPEDIM